MPGLEDYFDRWALLHGGYDPRTSPWTRPWLTLTYRVAGPLARAQVAPGWVTGAGLLASGAVVGLTAAGGNGLAGGAALVVLSGLLDNLDGAVAILTDRVTPWGYVLDSAVDRCSDSLYVLALWVAGAPGPLCAAAGALTLLQEYVRARAAAGGFPGIGVVTVSERPTRVIVTALFLLGGAAGGRASSWATAGAAAWATLGAIGCTQLLAVVRRRLLS